MVLASHLGNHLCVAETWTEVTYRKEVVSVQHTPSLLPTNVGIGYINIHRALFAPQAW